MKKNNLQNSHIPSIITNENNHTTDEPLDMSYIRVISTIKHLTLRIAVPALRFHSISYYQPYIRNISKFKGILLTLAGISTATLFVYPGRPSLKELLLKSEPELSHVNEKHNNNEEAAEVEEVTSTPVELDDASDTMNDAQEFTSAMHMHEDQIEPAESDDLEVPISNIAFDEFTTGDISVFSPHVEIPSERLVKIEEEIEIPIPEVPKESQIPIENDLHIDLVENEGIGMLIPINNNKLNDRPSQKDETLDTFINATKEETPRPQEQTLSAYMEDAVSENDEPTADSYIEQYITTANDSIDIPEPITEVNNGITEIKDNDNSITKINDSINTINITSDPEIPKIDNETYDILSLTSDSDLLETNNGITIEVPKDDIKITKGIQVVATNPVIVKEPKLVDEFITPGVSKINKPMASTESINEEPVSESPSAGSTIIEPIISDEPYNPNTGEINWDSPSLGGLAHGTCGEEFRIAFSCFVHSKTIPNGSNCIEKFNNMQNCFKLYPEFYSDSNNNGTSNNN